MFNLPVGLSFPALLYLSVEIRMFAKLNAGRFRCFTGSEFRSGHSTAV